VQRVTVARQTLALAQRRYTAGLTRYLDVLDAERQLLAAEFDLAAITHDQLTAVVQVYKALGGGWDAPPAEGRVEQP
jgi:multidrug efflux system outer membrane protein